MIQTYTDIRFSLLLNSEMTNVKPNWISCLFGPHILFSKRISFRSQGKLWAAACVSASDVVYRSTWWGSGECRVKSSPGSARQVPGPARLGPGHTDSSPTSLFPWPFFFFFFLVLSSVHHASWGKSASIWVGVQRVSLSVPTKVPSRLAVNPDLGLIQEKYTYQQL